MASNFDKIPIEPLDVDNYGEWRGQMVPYLTYLGFYAAIEEPASDEGKKVDAKCRALIILKCKTFHHSEVEDKKTAKEVWDELETLYKKVSNSRIAQLKIALQSLKMEANEPVVKYIARTRALASELKGAGKPVAEDDLAINVLNGLTGDFKSLRTILLNGSEELNLSVIQSKLIEHDQALDLDEEKEEEEKQTTMAFAARHQNSSRANGAHSGERSCFGCGKPGHIKKRCRTTGPECYKCGKRGHLERECREERESSNFCRTMAFAVLNKEGKEYEWILDSGCKVHLCNEKALFKNLKSAGQHDKVCGIGGAQKGELKIEAYGEVTLKCNLPEGGHHEVNLLNVAFVPEAAVNLISMSCLTKKGVAVAFEGKKALATLGSRGVLKAEEKGGLFVVEVTKEGKTSQQSEKQNKPKEADSVQGKQPMEIVHVHVSKGEKLMVTIVDDFSKLSVVQPVRSKEEAESAVPEMIEKIEKQSWKKTKLLVVNGSSVKKGGEVDEFCKKKGVEVLQTKSGPAEGVSKSLLERAAEALTTAKMDETFWGEAVGMANVSRNREKQEGSRSPWEKFDKSSQWTVEHTFGEEVKVNGGKEKGVFVGYAGRDGKSFRVLRVGDGKVIVTKDVNFKKDEKKGCLEDAFDPADGVEGDQAGPEDKPQENQEAVGATDVGAARKSTRVHKPPNRLSLFARSTEAKL